MIVACKGPCKEGISPCHVYLPEGIRFCHSTLNNYGYSMLQPYSKQNQTRSKGLPFTHATHLFSDVMGDIDGGDGGIIPFSPTCHPSKKPCSSTKIVIFGNQGLDKTHIFQFQLNHVWGYTGYAAAPHGNPWYPSCHHRKTMVDPHGLFHGLSQCIPMAYPIFHGEITTILAGYIRKSSTLFGEFPMIHPWICKGTAGNPSPKNLLIPQVVDFPLGEKNTILWRLSCLGW